MQTSENIMEHLGLMVQYKPQRTSGSQAGTSTAALYAGGG